MQESTLDAQLLSYSSRTGDGGALLYDYEYSLDSTRGLKRILNTVTITGEGAACAAAPTLPSLLLQAGLVMVSVCGQHCMCHQADR